MPFLYRIDTTIRVVVTAGHGMITDVDVFGYQREVWSRPDVGGYDELIDMTRVTSIEVSSSGRVRDLAALSADMDATVTGTRLAIVAPDDLAYGLGRMYQNYRELNPLTRREVGVFRTMEEALAFLQIEHAVSLPDLP
jgi:hypothetical protein